MRLMVNGFGETLGDSLAIAKPVQMSGNAFYVNSATGSDIADGSGKNREKPLATLGQALSNCANDDVIILASGHIETFTEQFDITKRVKIIGADSSGGKPTAKFAFTGPGSSRYVNVTADLVEFRNILFQPVSAASSTVPRITVASDAVKFYGCYWECAEFDQDAGLSLSSNSDFVLVDGCTFVSTATGASPLSALAVTVATSGLTIRNTVFSAGTVGFRGHYALDIRSAATACTIEGISLLLGADMRNHASSTGLINAETVTGGSTVDW